MKMFSIAQRSVQMIALLLGVYALGLSVFGKPQYAEGNRSMSGILFLAALIIQGYVIEENQGKILEAIKKQPILAVVTYEEPTEPTEPTETAEPEEISASSSKTWDDDEFR
jgi:hypothetical protein